MFLVAQQPELQNAVQANALPIMLIPEMELQQMFGNNQVSFMDGASTMNMGDNGIKKLDFGNSMNSNFNKPMVYGDITTPDVHQSINT